MNPLPPLFLAAVLEDLAGAVVLPLALPGLDDDLALQGPVEGAPGDGEPPLLLGQG